MLKIRNSKKEDKPTLKSDGRINNIQVLYDAKGSKSAPTPVKRRRKRDIFGYYKGLNMFYNSKSSCDVNEFRYRQYKPNLCYQLKCKSNSFLQCHRYCDNCNRQDFFYKSEKQSENRSSYKISPVCNCCTPMHYKLLNFPSNNMNKCFEFKTSSSRNCRTKSPVVIQQTRIHRGVMIKPSCFQCTSGAGDSVECHNSIKPKIELSNCNIKKQKSNCDNAKFRCKVRKRCVKPRISLFAIYFNQNYFVLLIKMTLKCFLFGFAILAWSPCIVSVFVYWLITYPLRPQHIFRQAKLDSFYKYGSCFNGSEFWRLIFHSTVRALEKVGHAYNALCSSIKNQNYENTNVSKPCLPRPFTDSKKLIGKHRKFHICVNPKKRYTLYYARNRGWIMKSVRKCRKRKQSLHKCLPNIDKQQDLKENNRCPGFLNIRNHASSTSLKNKSCINMSCNRPINGDNIIEQTTCLSKMVSTRSSPLLTNTECLINNRSLTKSLFNNFESCQTPAIYQKENAICVPYYTEIPMYEKSAPICTPKCKFRLGNVPYDIQTSSRSIKNITRKKHLRPTCYNYQYLGSNGKRSAGPCSYSQKRILLHGEQCPCGHKNTFAKHLRKKQRPKYHISSVKSCRNITLRQKVFNYCKSTFNKLRSVVRETDSEVWKTDICNDMYASTLRKKPWFWVYKNCPSFYPYFLVCCKFNKDVGHCLLYVISACVWCPMICCCYFCYELFCKCACY